MSDKKVCAVACSHNGWLAPIPDGLCREPRMIGCTVWCQSCGESWAGSAADELQALTEEIASLPAKQSDTKEACGVCEREHGHMNDELPKGGTCPRRAQEAWDGRDRSDCYRLGYERLAAILTPEVLRLIEAARKWAAIEQDEWLAFTRPGLQAHGELIKAALALPFEKPAESNHTEKQQLPKKGGEPHRCRVCGAGWRRLNSGHWQTLDGEKCSDFCLNTDIESRMEPL